MLIRSLILFLFLLATTAHAQFTPFAAGPSVTLTDYGALPNDSIADTPALIAAMSGGGRTVVIPAGDWLIGTVSVPSNTVLQLSPGTVLRDTGQLPLGVALINVRSPTVNARIVGTGASVLANRAHYTSGEHRHGLIIFGARNVEIVGLESSSHGGDGFYVGGNARDVRITGCRANNNRRQGLSITGTANLYVQGCTFAFTDGTAPRLGVDIEPNGNVDLLQNIRLDTVTTRSNVGGGIGVHLSAWTAAALPANIVIFRHTSVGESRPFAKSSIRPGDSLSYTPVVTIPCTGLSCQLP